MVNIALIRCETLKIMIAVKGVQTVITDDY